MAVLPLKTIAVVVQGLGTRERDALPGRGPVSERQLAKFSLALYIRPSEWPWPDKEVI